MDHHTRTVRHLRSRRLPWRRHRAVDAFERKNRVGDGRQYAVAHRNTPHVLKSTPPAETATQFWWRHARWPLTAFLAAALLFASTHIELGLASALFFDASGHHWRGAGNWWINDFLHTGGRWAVRIVVALALAVWIAALFDRSMRRLQRPLGYFVVAMILTIGVVGLLKTVTNIDCPWDLEAFGGSFPYVQLFAARPIGLRHAQCFPAAHASTGYAFMALYFVAYERSRRLAVLGLGAGLLLGLIFGIAQQARGAHFASHDLWSAFLAWIIPLTVYAFAFRARLHPCADPHLRRSTEQVQ
jgi:membrane-associated PAP2 superfamily phosphatase